MCHGLYRLLLHRVRVSDITGRNIPSEASFASFKSEVRWRLAVIWQQQFWNIKLSCISVLKINCIRNDNQQFVQHLNAPFVDQQTNLQQINTLGNSNE